MAFKEITANGTRAGQNREILEFLRTTGKAFTSFEIAKALGVDRSGPGRRMSDLEVAGLVRRRPIRPCQITGRPSITWEAI
jgi:predicted ArsR family transcriptional regulator